jgi:hypothetical protein
VRRNFRGIEHEEKEDACRSEGTQLRRAAAWAMDVFY